MWLETIKTHHPTVLEAGNLNPSVSGDFLFLGLCSGSLVGSGHTMPNYGTLAFDKDGICRSVSQEIAEEFKVKAKAV